MLVYWKSVSYDILLSIIDFRNVSKRRAFHEEDGESRGDCYGIRLFENKAIRSSGEE